MKTQQKITKEEIKEVYGIDPSSQLRYKGLDIWHLSTTKMLISKDQKLLGTCYFVAGFWYTNDAEDLPTDVKANESITAIFKTWKHEVS